MSEPSEIPPTPIYLRQSMVERVAREICSRSGCLPDRILGDSPAWQSFEPTARAVLKVMREPNLAMRKACSFKDAEVTWPKMIDAALGPEA